MTAQTDVKTLSRDQIELLAMCPVDQSFVAADIPWSRPGPTGNALNRLAERGLLIAATDPEKWGRSRYIADPIAIAKAIEARSAKLGVPFVGIERDQRYFEAACERVLKVSGEDVGPLFGEAA